MSSKDAKIFELISVYFSKNFCILFNYSNQDIAKIFCPNVTGKSGNESLWSEVEVASNMSAIFGARMVQTYEKWIFLKKIELFFSWFLHQKNFRSSNLFVRAPSCAPILKASWTSKNEFSFPLSLIKFEEKLFFKYWFDNWARNRWTKKVKKPWSCIFAQTFVNFEHEHVIC